MGIERKFDSQTKNPAGTAIIYGSWWREVYWKRFRRFAPETRQSSNSYQAKGCRRGEGSHRRRRRAGKSQPRLSAYDCEGARAYVDHRDLLRARGKHILALAADVPGNSDANRVLSGSRHPHRSYQQIFFPQLSESASAPRPILLLIDDLSDTT